MAAGTGSAVELAGLTDVGLKRQNNEDSFTAFEIPPAAPGAPPVYCLAVADGMGGMEHGERASTAAIGAVEKLLPQALRLGKHVPDLARVLGVVIEAADEAAGRATDSPGQSGTTIVLALVQGDKAYVGSVGDSRAYLMSQGSLSRLTTDHTVSPGSNVLTQALGTGRPITPSATVARLKPGDTLLLASDGLHYYLKDQDLSALLSRPVQDLNGLCRALVDRAKAGGGHDNITVVAARTPAGQVAPVAREVQPLYRRWEIYGVCACLLVAGALSRQLFPPRPPTPTPTTKASLTCLQDITRSRQSAVFRLQARPTLSVNGDEPQPAEKTWSVSVWIQYDGQRKFRVKSDLAGIVISLPRPKRPDTGEAVYPCAKRVGSYYVSDWKEPFKEQLTGKAFLRVPGLSGEIMILPGRSGQRALGAEQEAGAPSTRSGMLSNPPFPNTERAVSQKSGEGGKGHGTNPKKVHRESVRTSSTGTVKVAKPGKAPSYTTKDASIAPSKNSASGPKKPTSTKGSGTSANTKGTIGPSGGATNPAGAPSTVATESSGSGSQQTSEPIVAEQTPEKNRP